jgi:hypothetical protein
MKATIIFIAISTSLALASPVPTNTKLCSLRNCDEPAPPQWGPVDDPLDCPHGFDAISGNCKAWDVVKVD